MTDSAISWLKISEIGHTGGLIELRVSVMREHAPRGAMLQCLFCHLALGIRNACLHRGLASYGHAHLIVLSVVHCL